MENTPASSIPCDHCSDASNIAPRETECVPQDAQPRTVTNSMSSAEPNVIRPKVGARLSRETQGILRQWFNAHSDHPYPDDATKEAFRRLTGLSKTQLNNWFANARRRYESTPSSTQAPQSIDIPRRQGTPRPRQEAFNPMQRWIDSPPDDEPAPVSAIVRAVAESSSNPSPENNSYPTLYQSSMSSGGTSRQSSSSSAWSGGSSTHQGLPRHRVRRRKRAKGKPQPSKPTPFECTFCTEMFSKKYDWQRHEISIHLGLERWVCHAGKAESLHPENGKRCCIFCSQEEPDQEHNQAHNPLSCQERVFNRKDHLRQHLRLVHQAEFIPWSMDTWKNTISEVRSRCGFCGISFNTWQARSDHLSEHFKMGQTMAAWTGDWGFDKEIAEMVENAIPPYLVCTERNSPFPFQGSTTAASSPCSAYELITLELMQFVEIYHEENASMPTNQILQLEACRIIFASETMSTLDSSHHDPPSSWLRDVIMSNNEIVEQALFGPIRSRQQNRLPSLEVKGQRSLFDNCPLELGLRMFVECQRNFGRGDIWDAELQQEACRIMKNFKAPTIQQSYKTVLAWLTDTILRSADWLLSFRQRMALLPDVPQPHLDPKLNEGDNGFMEDTNLRDLGNVFLQQDLHASNTASSDFPQQNIMAADDILNGSIDIGADHGANQSFWAAMSTYTLNDSNFHEKLGKELGRWVASTMSPRNPISHVPTDDELRHQARWIAYGDDDPWNQTHADNPEWLQRFKDSVGLQ